MTFASVRREGGARQYRVGETGIHSTLVFAYSVFRWLSRASQLGAGLVLLAPSVSLASVDVCSQPSEASRVAVSYYDYPRSDVAELAGQVRRTNQNFDFHYALDETWSFGAAYRYAILDMEPIEPQTNGHLHTVSFPIQRQTRDNGKGFRLSIAPTLSASSNVMKDPGEYSQDTLQVLFALVWNRQLPSGATLYYGICGDHRFGKYTPYPSIGIGWRPHPQFLVQMGFPTTRLTFSATRSTDFSLRIAPDGNEWHVKNKDLDKQSQLIHKASLAELTLNWRATDRHTMTVAVGRHFRNRYEVTLQDDGVVTLTDDSAMRLGAALEWRF